jgi:Zn-dependent peptidase ImmA (M78 family)
MRLNIPVNPGNLKWARESVNLLIEDVAARMKQDPRVIQAWEEGVSSPTYVQLEKLAYQVYKRPIAIFFFPEPPEEISPRKSFRTLPDAEIEALSPRFFQLFRQAQAMQVNLDELNDGANPAARKIFRDLHFNLSDKLSTQVETVREYLGINLETQADWRDSDTAFKEWRRSIESVGVFIFKEAFKQDDISGFCLYDDEFPVVYVNNSMPQTRQIFTLFHELPHLLVKVGGIDTDNDAYLRQIHGDNKRIEILCNRFAAEFLVPSNDFGKIVSGADINDELVENLARRYKVSREVILRKCLDRRLIEQRYYEERRQVWIDEAKKARHAAKGGDYYLTRAAYLGDSYLNMVFGQYYRRQFSTAQLAEYLGVRVDYVVGMEAAFLGRGEPG